MHRNITQSYTYVYNVRFIFPVWVPAWWLHIHSKHVRQMIYQSEINQDIILFFNTKILYFSTVNLRLPCFREIKL